MKRFALLSAFALSCVLSSAQAQAPAAPAVPAAPSPANSRKLLESMRDTNAKLLEQQAKTLQLLEEMEKTSQTLKTLGKRA